MIPRVAIALLVLATFGCGSQERLDDAMLQRSVAKLTTDGFSGAIALVRADGDVWRGASGYENYRTKQRADPTDRFAVESTTKTFVATVILQLVDEGRLSLDDTLETLLPGRLPYGRRVTLRQVLNHTSGLPAASSIAEAARQRLQSRPGSTFNYSNFNYVVAGTIVERVTGHRLDRVLRERIIRPLRLTHTTSATTGYAGIVSTVDDLATFFQALLGGRLLDADRMSEMTRVVEAGAESPGLGLFRIRTPCGFAWGHGGAGMIDSSMSLASRDGSKVVVVADNAADFDGAESAAEEMYCAAG